MNQSRTESDHSLAKEHFLKLGATSPYDERMRQRIDEAPDDAFQHFLRTKNLVDAKAAISARKFIRK